MVTIENARANFTIVQSFFRRSFSALSSINYNKSETLIMNISIHDPKFDLFLSPCQKSRLLETICSLQLIAKIGHFLPVFCPYLEFSAWLSLAMSATLKHIVDYDTCVLFSTTDFARGNSNCNGP